MGWDLSCSDWEVRLAAGRSLIPNLPLWDEPANQAVAIFDRLRLADVEGTPMLSEACGDWFREIVRAIFGSLDPLTRERMVRELLLLIPKKQGKALALDTPVATPKGFKNIGDIEVGDQVMAADGTPTYVIAKSEVFTDRQCFEVEFSTGEKIICDAQHLWVTDAHRDRQKQKTRKADNRSNPRPSVKTTAEIAATLHVKSGRLTINNHRTALAKSLDLPEAELAIPPYALGAWLGDGHSAGAVITQSEEDANEMISLLLAAGQNAYRRGSDPRTGAVAISLSPNCHRNARPAYRFRAELVKAGLLGNKHIPQIYLRGSLQQRLELLRGLMDTDGTISDAGQAEFTTTSPALRDGVRELVASVGLKPNMTESRATLYGKDCGPAWAISFWPFDQVRVFNLTRKADRQRPSKAVNASRSRHRQIFAVRPLDSVPTQCIAVSNSSHQFLIGRSLLPTHNTSYGALLMLVALLVNTRPQASMIFTAPVQRTAEMAFDQVAGAIRLDSVLSKKMHIRDNVKTIEHRVTGAVLEILTFDPSVLTGRKCHAVMIDELHLLAKNAHAESCIRQLRGGMSPFSEAFLMFTTTQSEEQPAGVFAAELQGARDIRDGKTPGIMLPVLYEWPLKLQQDVTYWEDPSNWWQVTPNLGRGITLARLVDARDAEKRSGDAQYRAWATQHLNVQIGVAIKVAAWNGALYWEACKAKEQPELLRGHDGLKELFRRCEVIVAGLDGGGNDDLYGLAIMGRDTATKKWLVWVHAWVQRSVLELRKSEAQRFTDFETDGDLTIIDRPGEDIEQIVEIMLEVEESGLLDRIGVDRAGIQDTVQALVDAGFELERIVAIDQGWKLVGTIKTTERKLKAREIEHGGTRMMNWCLGNARAEPRGNAVIITKQTAGTAKIDPLLAVFNCSALMVMDPKPRKKLFQMFTLGGS